jgi:hypothetical protein
MTKTLQDYLNEQKAWEDIPLKELDIAMGPDRQFWTLCEIAKVIDPQRARYAPRDGQTFCNIYVSDFTRAWGYEIPHKMNGVELTADKTGRMIQAGEIPRWKQCSGPSAGIRAVLDEPVVAFSPGAPGHIAIVTVDMDSRELWVHQAGSKCGYMPIKEGFGKQFPYVKYAYYDRDHKP